VVPSGPTDMADLCAEAVHWQQRRERRAIDSTGARDLVEFQAIVRGHWHAFAQISAWHLKEHGARVDSSRLGYVVLPVNGVEAHIPFFMTDMMPLGGDLKDMVALGAEVRLSRASVICLSGSTCQVGKVRQIADLDFCEYAPRLDAESSERLATWACRSDARGPRLLRLTLGADAAWSAPWSKNLLDPTMPSAIVLSKLQDAKFRQCVFVAEVSRFGVLEVTNVVLDLDYAMPESAPEATNSFAFQEIALSGAAWTPRDLSSPIRLGEYLIWLLGSARKHCEESRASPRAVTKAMRRMISACRLMMLGPEVDTLVDLLRRDGALLASLLDRCKLYKAIQASPGRQLDAVRGALQATIKSIRSDLAPTTTGKIRTQYGSLTGEEQLRFCQYADMARPIVETTVDRVTRQLRLE
jgi:hypothetical protein